MPGRSLEMKTEHILIIRFSSIGDVAMTVPVVYSLAQQYPRLRITMLSKPFAKPLFDNLAPNVGFMEADLKNEYHGLKGLNALYRRLTAKNFTAIADLHNVLRSDYLRMRFNFGMYHVAHLDKHRLLRKQLTSYNNKVLKPIPTAFDNYKQVLAELGYPIDIKFKSIFSNGENGLSQLPACIGEKKAFQQWIGVAPFAAHPGKTYPLQRMEQVIAEMVRLHPSCRIFLFSGKGREAALLKDIADKYRNCLCVAPVLDGLRQELVLMSHLDVMVSMDSANMHLASLVGTPVVSVWGATHPFAGFMGWGQSPENIVQMDLPCRPCSIYGNKPCRRGDYACMERIDPGMIVEKIERLIK